MRWKRLAALAGRLLAAFFWMSLMVSGLVILDERRDDSVSPQVFLVTVGLLGLGLVVRSMSSRSATSLPPVSPLVELPTRRRVVRRRTTPGVSRIAWARKHEQSRHQLARDLTRLAERRPGAPRPEGPALTQLREGSGPADIDLIDAAISELEAR